MAAKLKTSSANLDPARLSDFTTDLRVIPLSLIAIGLGVVSSYLAVFLLKLIGFFTNLFFFQRFATQLTSPALNRMGWMEVFVPVIGGLLVGVMARYGSERIRGHGIPEAIEAILLRGARVEPKVTLLKPISAAIAIGSGGPFGAEGPIIMTGGAFGSLVAQFFRLSSAERKTLLVAGAAAGMSATFAAPVAAVLLAVELLLFEWKPRSLIPVALASATAASARHHLMGPGPLFPTMVHAPLIDPAAMFGCVFVGLIAGALAAILSSAIYFFEDAFHHLPIHWMWWPAIGGVIIGVGGLINPQALGVGYDVIASMLAHDLPFKVLLGIFLVKGIIWSVSLGSGTSGGVLAPLLIMGGAIGGLEAHVLPGFGPGFWPLISMAAVLGGAMGSPLMAVVFAFELTHDPGILLPLLISALVSYGFVVLTLPRSILTEKLSRRGYHLSREYVVDPMEGAFVRDVMQTDMKTLPPDATLREAQHGLQVDENAAVQRLFPVVDNGGNMLGVIPRWELEQFVDGKNGSSTRELIQPNPMIAFADEPLRFVVQRMASTGLTKFPVVERNAPTRPIGMVALTDLLKARVAHIESEERREQVLRLPLLFGSDDQNREEPA